MVCEIAQLHDDEVEKSKQSGAISPPLEEALEEARVYYLSRVESRHRELFSEAVDRYILGRE